MLVAGGDGEVVLVAGGGGEVVLVAGGDVGAEDVDIAQYLSLSLSLSVYIHGIEN